MQGLPTNLLTQNVATAAGKVDSNSPVIVNTVDGKETKAESQNAFASIFAGLLGNSEATAETKVEGKTEGSKEGSSKENKDGKLEILKGEVALESKAATGPEVKLDVLLKNKDQEKNKKTDVGALSTEAALSPEVLKNIEALATKAPMPEIGEKVAATSTNLDQLLKSLKGNTETKEGEVIDPSESKDIKKAKTESPLDFLLKQSKESDVGVVETKETKALQKNPELVSKLGLSSEDFLSHKAEAKDLKNIEKSEKSLGQQMNLDSEIFDPKAFAQKQMNQSMKSYGQKQNLLSDNIIRSPKDLLTKEGKSKSAIDELTSPYMKIALEASQVKEQFIPVMQKTETAQNTTTQGSEKVLDLSKINSSNTNEIIKKISDYIEQSQVANKDSLDLTVKHDSLGQFKIQVNRPVGSNASNMDMQITTSTAEGHDFFMKNEISLMKNLSQAGIQLSDLRIVSESGSSSFAGNDSRQSNNSQNGSQSGREFMSFEASGDSSHGSDRRRELWQEARNNQQRYGA